MSAINPNETSGTWRHHGRELPVQLYLSDTDGDAGAALVGARPAGFPVTLKVVPVTEWIDAAELAGAAVAIVQVDADTPASIRRFEKLAAASSTPLIAVAYDPPLSLVRMLIRGGAHDVIPLPLDLEELEASLAPLRSQLDGSEESAARGHSRLVTVVKSVGGVGATALLTQLALRFAEREQGAGRDACLIDFDVQFGDAAFYLGLRPKLSLADLVEAGPRMDGEMLRAATTPHPSGLKLIAAPAEMMPLEALNNEQALDLVELAMAEFGTVFVDLPANWTNWSLSLLARSDVVLLITEMNVASLSRARRQLDLIAAQELDGLDLRVVVNRFEKGAFKSIKAGDVREALGHDIAYTIANDHSTMRAAIDRGVPLEAIKRKTALAKDLDALDAGLAAALRLER